MSSMGTQDKTWDFEIEGLRARLEEAEQTLSAIRGGEVDAIVVSRPEGERIFTITGAEQTYRILVEAMNEGAVTLLPDGTILYANSRFAELVKTPLKQVIGSTFQRFVPPPERAVFEALLSQGEKGRSKGELTLQSRDRALVPVQLSIGPWETHDIRALCMVVTDISKHKRIEDALLRAHDELEIRVQERTVELEQANAALQAEINERERAEKALRESEERLRLALDAAQMYTWDRDTLTNRLTTSGRHDEVFGLAPGAFGGTYEAFLALVHPADREAIATSVAHAIEDGGLFKEEFRIIRADGTIRWIAAQGRPYRDETGKVVRMIGISQDVTERKQAELALGESEGRFQAFMNNSPALAFMKDAEGRYAFANRTLERNFGVRWEHLRGKTDFDFLPKELAERLRENDRLVLATGKPLQVIETAPAPDGGLRRWLVLKFPFTDAQEKRYVGGKAIDITERERAEAQVAESRGRLKALFDNTQDAILLADDEARIVDVNPAACALFGYDRERFLQLNVWDITPIPDRKLSRNLWREFIAAGQQGGDYTIQRKDGTTRAVEYRAVAHIVPGLHLSVIRDVTERKQAEEALRESTSQLRGLAAHLESVREEQSARIAREVHDELGGTLTVLKLGLGSMLDKIKEPQAVQDKLASMLTLTDGAIETVKRISTHLRPSMLDTLGLLVTIEWHVKEFSKLTRILNTLSMPEHIRLSPERSTAVFRIIQETLTNVARHAKATKVAIRLWKSKDRLLVEIQDNGKGITDDALSKPGSFGLLSMRERSQFLRGELKIRRASGQGTMVRLSLPLET